MLPSRGLLSVVCIPPGEGVDRRAVAVVGAVDSVGRRVLRLSTLSTAQEAKICSLDSVPRCLPMFGPFHAVMQRRAADEASVLHRPKARELRMDDGAVEVEMSCSPNYPPKPNIALTKNPAAQSKDEAEFYRTPKV